MNALTKIMPWPADPTDLLELALWDAVAIARATGGVAVGEFQVSGVEIDSRDVVPGDLFFALKGEAMDGHKFVEMAFARGAAAVVVDRPVEGPHVLVNDTNAALIKLAKAARARVDATIVGVTGSVGKTGVKEAIFAALDRSSRGGAHRSVKSYNNHVGVPLSLARTPARSRFGVFEMGMNHAGEIAALTAQVRPHVAVITTIAPAHIEMLGSEEAIADAKAEIFEGLEPGGVADHSRRQPAPCADQGGGGPARCRHSQLRPAAHADVRLLDAVAGAQRRFAGYGRSGRPARSAIPLPSRASTGLPIRWRDGGGARGGRRSGRGRDWRWPRWPGWQRARRPVGGCGGDGTGRALLIDESYNANPASMRATLAQLGKTPRQAADRGSGGDEGTGRTRPGLPRSAAGADCRQRCGLCRMLVGDEMQVLADEMGKDAASALGKGTRFAHCETAAEAIKLLNAHGLAWGGDAVLVKGSNSVGLGAVVAALAQNKE
jgi:UDP-N-acetylmuramoyl-tripeptide--D-alanyl-D-alanine ligase